jgi:NAD(P)-dependent dehydrogenase (short-subunit alcohol dehydrogenase family)
MMEFLGKLAVVTGGNRGIGRVVALAFAREGADVVVTARDGASLDDTASEIRSLGRESLAVAADLTTQAGAEALAGMVSERFGSAHVVVTSAGIRDHANVTVAEMDPAAYGNVVQSNILSTVLPIRALLPGMIARRQGKIVTISGVFGIRGRARHAGGVSSKWAIEGFMRSLAIEAGEHNINVNSVCPGYVEGARSKASLARIAAERGVTPETVKQELEERTALKRLSTEADISNAVLFLASERARNVTGQDLVVDAGWTTLGA